MIKSLKRGIQSKRKISEGIINTNLDKVIKHREKERKTVILSYCNILQMSLSCSCLLDDKKNMKQLYKAVNEKFNHKLDLISFFKHQDQHRLLTKFFFNEHQYFMLQNRGKQLIVCKKLDGKKDKEKQEEYEAKLKELNEYLKGKKPDKIDTLLYSYFNSN